MRLNARSPWRLAWLNSLCPGDVLSGPVAVRHVNRRNLPPWRLFNAAISGTRWRKPRWFVDAQRGFCATRLKHPCKRARREWRRRAAHHGRPFALVPSPRKPEPGLARRNPRPREGAGLAAISAPGRRAPRALPTPCRPRRNSRAEPPRPARAAGAVPASPQLPRRAAASLRPAVCSPQRAGPIKAGRVLGPLCFRRPGRAQQGREAIEACGTDGGSDAASGACWALLWPLLRRSGAWSHRALRRRCSDPALPASPGLRLLRLNDLLLVVLFGGR